jgi:hypothetical protein
MCSGECLRISGGLEDLSVAMERRGEEDHPDAGRKLKRHGKRADGKMIAKVETPR